MMNGRMILAVAMASLILPMVSATAQERSFACEGGASDQASALGADR